MANLTVQKVKNEEERIAFALEDPRDTFEMIRRRAFEVFEQRGGNPGNEVDDWLQAERDLFCVPPAELTETAEEIQITVSVPGFAPKQVQVTAEPGEILVRGDHGFQDFSDKSLYRRFEIGQPIDVDHVTANFENGILTVTAPKKAPQASADNKKTATAA